MSDSLTPGPDAFPAPESGSGSSPGGLEGPSSLAAAPKRARRNPLFFVVICLLITDIVFGLGLAVFAQTILQFPPMAVMGLGLAVLGVGILAYFLLLGDGRNQPAPAKEAKRMKPKGF
jgi:hypothetical protein